MEHILLEPSQKELLCHFVEADRQQSPDQPKSFTLVEVNSSPTCVQHPDLPGQGIPAFAPDVETLEAEGLIRFSSRQRGFSQFTITPTGFKYYEYLKTRSGEPTQRLESEIKQYLDTEAFQARYPAAYQKWSEAEKLLWGADSDQRLTVIGHLCREAMQEFADTLVKLHKPLREEPNKAKTFNRICSVIEPKKQQLGDSKSAFLDALLPYSKQVISLMQRQEHGGLQEKESLTWEDGRRVTFQTMVVMFEIDRALNS